MGELNETGLAAALAEGDLRNDHRNVVAGAVAGLGGAIAIGVMELFSFAAHYPLAVIPFATSIVLVIGSPDVEPAQPRALIGGHVVSALVGLAVLKLTDRRPGRRPPPSGFRSWPCT